MTNTLQNPPGYVSHRDSTRGEACCASPKPGKGPETKVPEGGRETLIIFVMTSVSKPQPPPIR